MLDEDEARENRGNRLSMVSIRKKKLKDQPKVRRRDNAGPELIWTSQLGEGKEYNRFYLQLREKKYESQPEPHPSSPRSRGKGHDRIELKAL